jgi:crotonobetainyl-CoA:carnitine CoA-transferase CaiB-like acyl-CoA transferase
MLEDANVPCGPINRVDQLFADPQAIARHLAIPVQRSDGGALKLVASPLRLAKTPPEYRTGPPRLGEHTEEILRDQLGLPPREIEGLRAAAIIG